MQNPIILSTTKRNPLVFAILIFICISGCSGKDCLTKSGNLTTETRTLSGYKDIEVNGIFNIELANGDSSILEVTSGENILSHIKTEIRDSVLYISNDISCRFVRGFGNFPEININIPRGLKSILLTSASNLTTKDSLEADHILFKFLSPVASANLTLKTKLVAFELWGKAAGDFKLSGETKYLTLLNDGLAEIDAKNLKARFASIESYAAADSYLSVYGTLKSRIFAEGNVFYVGTPTLLSNEELSSGKLIQREVHTTN